MSIDLPPLPESKGEILWHTQFSSNRALGYTGLQMKEYALSAIAAITPQWQPISSADAATPVLTYGADGIKIAFYYDGSWVEQSGDDLFVIEVPTHWQPLPAAPEVE